jgi:hypothetical protein
MADPGTIAVKVALTAAQMALTAMQHTKGPRLESRKVTLADYGAPINRFWGIRRLEGCPIFWAEDLREKKVTSKTKGGKYSDYKYFGTWGVLICDHEIDSVTRIWMDKHLVYDVSGAGPISPASLFRDSTNPGPVKMRQGKNMRVYLGTEDQEPDPRMEAWCEDEYGAGTCPAYRGSSYIVFENIPLEKFGNRIPQITVEAVNVSNNSYPYRQVEGSGYIDAADQHNFTTSNSNWMLRYAGNAMEWWDLSTSNYIAITHADNFSTSLISNKAMAEDGTVYWVGAYVEGADVGTYLMIATPAGNITRTRFDEPFSYIGHGPVRVFDILHQRHIYTGGASGGYHSGIAYIPFGDTIYDFCIDDDENIWGLSQPNGSSDEFTLNCLTAGGPPGLTIVGTVTRGSPGVARFCYVAEYEHFLVLIDGQFYFIDATTGAIKDTGAATFGSEALPWNDPYELTFWQDYTEYSLEDLSVVRTVAPFDWLVETSPEMTYDPVTHAIIGSSGTHLTWRYLDRVGSDGTLLRNIVEDVSGWVGLTDVDAMDLDQVVQGYSVVQGSAKEMLNPLLDMHDSDARLHNFDVQFIKRGDAAGGTLLTADFARNGDGERFEVQMDQDTDLPYEVTVNFADVTRDQQTNTVISNRPLDAMDSQRKETIDFSTYVSEPDEAKRLSDRRFRRIWNGRGKVSVSLTPQELALEPGDVRNIQMDGVTWTARLIRMTLGRGAINTEWERDFPSLHQLGTATGPTMDGRTPDSIWMPGPTKGFVLDIPLVRDTDEESNPLLYYGAGSYGSGFPGAVVWQGDATGTSFTNDLAYVDSASAAQWGYTTGTLANANPWLWDRGNSVNVRAFGSALSNSTEAAINADPSINLAYLGGELINFTTATLEADGTYTLTGLRRGRRGTEGACSGHAAGDEFILVENLTGEAMSLSDVGNDLYFRVQTHGLAPDTAPQIDIDFSGATLKPRAPARVQATFDGADWTFTVIRRTRYGGSWNGSTIPLGEASEEYEIDIYSGATLKRTLTLTGTDTATYTNAQQVTDFGATQTTRPALKVFQLSDAVGRGFELAA